MSATVKDVQHYLRPGTLQLGALPPLSLYVHLPWCLKKCPYCDFNSHEVAQPATMPRTALPRRAGGRPGRRAAAGLGPSHPQHLHRRRHAQPVLAAGDRPPAGRHPRAAAARARLRDHARSQPRHLREGPLQGLPFGRRDAPVGRRAELQRRSPQGPGPRARPRPGHRRAGRGGRRLRDLQSRPDVRPAGPDHGPAGAGPGAGAGA